MTNGSIIIKGSLLLYAQVCSVWYSATHRALKGGMCMHSPNFKTLGWVMDWGGSLVLVPFSLLPLQLSSLLRQFQSNFNNIVCYHFIWHLVGLTVSYHWYAPRLTSWNLASCCWRSCLCLVFISCSLKWECKDSQSITTINTKAGGQ